MSEPDPRAAAGEGEEDVPVTPWHLKLLLVGLVLYLVYRFVELVIWAVDSAF